MEHDSSDLVAGAALRAAADDDIDVVADLLARRGDPEDADDLRLLAASPVGLDGTAVVELDGRVVATATVLDEQVRVGSVPLPAGQVELVACDESAEHRGYVRALMGWCHRLSQRRGHLLQVMIGIPYYYRRFGYAYSMPMHPVAPLARVPEAPAGFVVRRAGARDVPAMAALQDLEQARFDVAMPHQPACWGWLVARSGSTQWVAERDGRLVATARVVDTGDAAVLVGEVASASPQALRALMAEVAAGAGTVSVVDRGGVPGRALLLGARSRPDWFYARVARPAAVLEALRPDLSARLAVWAAQAGGSPSGEALMSFWESHIRFAYGPDGVGPVTAGGPHQRPVSEGGSGLPPDAIGALLLGCGAAGLEDRFPDAHLGAQRELMLALFPPRSADLLTFYLP
jgi:predicted N-acetyltransferase YhbS